MHARLLVARLARLAAIALTIFTASAFEARIEPDGTTVAVQEDEPSAVVIIAGSTEDSSGSCEVAEASVDPQAKANSCTLRSALELANTFSSTRTAVTILLASGTVHLTSTLPEVLGTLQIFGSSPVSGSSIDNRPADSQGADPNDAGFDPAAAAEGQAGQSAPIGTVLDGGGTVQILRSAAGSALHLHTLRFERGRAMGDANDGRVEESGDGDGGSGDVRASAGGCINALGTLVLHNVAARHCEAYNGGAIATEGDFESHHSVFEHNVAHHCGGALYYAALGQQTHLNKCVLRYCRDACGRQFGREGGSSRYALPTGAQAALPGGGAPARQLAHGGPHGPGGGHARAIDTSGALAQGPPLSGQPVPHGAHGHAELPGGERWRERDDPNVCVSWRQTGACDPDGEREPTQDRPCSSRVPRGASGFCECVGREHVRLTCEDTRRGPRVICIIACKQQPSRQQQQEPEPDALAAAPDATAPAAPADDVADDG